MEKGVNQRIKQVQKHYDLNEKNFIQKIGVAQSTYNSLFSRGSKPSVQLIESIANAFPQIDTRWLITGNGEMLKESASIIKGDITITGDNNRHIGHGNNYPAIIEIKENAIDVECPKCGEVIEVPNEAVLPLIPEEIAKQPDVDIEAWRHNNPHEMQEVDLRQIWGGGVFVMRVDTRAMEPEYREGTFLVLRKLPDLSFARTDGSPYVIDTMRPHTLFRYLSKERDGTYVLTAENDRRGPLYLCAEDIQNIYDIVGSFRIGR